MKPLMACLLLAAVLWAAPVKKPQPESEIEFIGKTAYPSVYALHAQQPDGGSRMRCTLTAFGDPKPSPDGGWLTRMLTASHCVSPKGEVEDLFEDKKNRETYLIMHDDAADEFTVWRAKLIGKGDQEEGEDFAVLEVHSWQKLPTLRLGVDPFVLSPVINIADPMGLGMQVFHGYVSRNFLDRHLGPSGSDWNGNLLLQMPGVNGGSSGSSLLCLDQRAICGVVIGLLGANGDYTTQVAVPISRFKRWYADIDKPQDKVIILISNKGPAEEPTHPNKPAKLWERVRGWLQHRTTEVREQWTSIALLWLLALTAGFLWSNLRRNRK